MAKILSVGFRPLPQTPPVLLGIGSNRELQRLFPAISMHIIYAQYQSRRLRGIRLADYCAIMEAVMRKDGTAAHAAAHAHVENVRAAIEELHLTKTKMAAALPPTV